MKLVSIILLLVGISIVMYLLSIDICGPDPGFGLDYQCKSRASLIENWILLGTIVATLSIGILGSSGAKRTQRYVKLFQSFVIGGILGFAFIYLFNLVTV